MADLELRVDHNVTYIVGRLESVVYQDLKSKLGYIPEDAYFMIKSVNEANKIKNEKWQRDKEWDGTISTVCYNKKFCKCSIKKEGTHFPTGLIFQAISLLKSHNIDFELVDIRKKHPRDQWLKLSDDFDISKPYQTKVISDACSRVRGIIKAATGSGKTAMISGIIAALGKYPTVVYVPSQDLLFQTAAEIERFITDHDGNKIKVGLIGGGVKKIENINVMTIQTAVRALGGVWIRFDDEDVDDDNTDISDRQEEIKNLIQNTKVLFFDECQHCRSETCQIISDYSVNAQYRYGCSGTPYRDQGDDILIESCFGETICDINASYLIKQGFLVRPTIYFKYFNNMKGSSKSSYVNIYKEAIVQNDLRNAYIAQQAKKLAHEGRSVLILCKQLKHGRILNKMIEGSIFLHGSTSKKNRLDHLNKMRDEEEKITIASTIFDQGINVRALDGLILAGSGKSPTRALQRIGRTLRKYPGKDDAIVIDFWDDCKYLKEHSRAREKIYKTEKEFKIIKDGFPN